MDVGTFEQLRAESVVMRQIGDDADLDAVKVHGSCEMPLLGHENAANSGVTGVFVELLQVRIGAR